MCKFDEYGMFTNNKVVNMVTDFFYVPGISDSLYCFWATVSFGHCCLSSNHANLATVLDFDRFCAIFSIQYIWSLDLVQF